jgi:hypothetical protein
VSLAILPVIPKESGSGSESISSFHPFDPDTDTDPDPDKRGGTSTLELVDFSGFLVFPVSPQRKREIELNRSGTGTIIGAATAVPAFFRVQNNRRLACLRMRYIHIDLARFYTDVAPVANFRVEDHRIVRRSNIGNRE